MGNIIIILGIFIDFKISLSNILQELGSLKQTRIKCVNNLKAAMCKRYSDIGNDENQFEALKLLELGFVQENKTFFGAEACSTFNKPFFWIVREQGDWHQTLTKRLDRNEIFLVREHDTHEDM